MLKRCSNSVNVRQSFVFQLKARGLLKIVTGCSAAWIRFTTSPVQSCSRTSYRKWPTRFSSAINEWLQHEAKNICDWNQSNDAVIQSQEAKAEYSRPTLAIRDSEVTIYQGLESLRTFWFDREHDKWLDLGPFEDKKAGLVQSMGAKGKHCWEAVEIGIWQSLTYPYSGIPLCKICRTALALDWSNLLWWQPSNVHKIWPDRTEKLSSSHRSNCKFCDLDRGKLMYQLTLDCGKVRRAKRPIPASLLQQKRCQNLRCWLFNLDRRGSFSCLSDTAFAYYIILQSISLSLANYHPVDCSPNMRVADCSTVWVCKRLQLMYLSALHLTLFDIYSTTVHSNETNASVKRVCLSAMAIYEGLEFLSRLWFAPEHHKW